MMGRQVESKLYMAGDPMQCSACGKRLGREDPRVYFKTTGSGPRWTCRGKCAEKASAEALGLDTRKYR